MLSSQLSHVLLLLPLLTLPGTHSLDPKDIPGGQELVEVVKKEAQLDVKEVVEEKSAQDEIMEDTVEYIRKGDEEDKMKKNADSEMGGREGRRFPTQEKETKSRTVTKSEGKINRNRGGGGEGNGKRVLNIKKLLKGAQDSTKKKKKKPVEKPGKNRTGNRKVPPKRKHNKGNEASNHEKSKKKTKKGWKNKNKGGYRKKGPMNHREYAMNTISSAKKHPVFSFSNYVLAACGETYMVTRASNFLFTTDGGKFARNCRTNFQSPPATTIKFYCPVFSLSQNKCKKESLLLNENKVSKWQFCRTDVVDIETLTNRLMVHHRRRRMTRKKCPGSFLCEVSLGFHYGPVTQKPYPVKPKPTYPPYPGTPPHPPPTTTQTPSTVTVPPTVPTTSTTTTTTTTTTTEATRPTTPKPVYPGPIHPGPIHPGPIHPGPIHPGPIHPGPHPPGPQPPGPSPIHPPAPVVIPPSTVDRPLCYGCSPFDITVTRIVGGAEAAVGEFPYQARLDIGPGTMCSGSLITTQFVLTAAHCYAKGFRETKVILGDHNLHTHEPQSLEVKAKKVIKHENFDSASMDNDIALLQLEYPVRFNKFIAPICLSTSKDKFKSPVAVASGWGHTQYSGYVSKTLQKVTLDYITNEECQDMYLTKYFITDNMLCTYTAEKDACQGDSGGPLVRKTDNTWVQIGITSYGYKCAEDNSPGVFTRVANYIDWIKKNLGYFNCY